MSKDSIELPPLPSGLELWNIGVSAPDGVGRAMQEYAIEAIEADRKRRGEPVARVDSDGFIVETGLSLAPGTLLFTAPQPAEPAREQAIPYAGVTVWVGDKRCSHGVTEVELEV